MSFSIIVPVAGIDAWADGLAGDAEQAARPAAQAGAQVLYEAVKANVAAIKRHTGNLERSIYQAYSADHSGQGRAIYHVSWNARKAPHGHLVEFGYLQRYEISYDPATKRFTTHKDKPLAQPKLVAARPFMRPAMARFDAAMAAVKAEFIRQIEGQA